MFPFCFILGNFFWPTFKFTDCFPQLYWIYWCVHWRNRFIFHMAFFISSISFWFILIFSISMLKFPLCDISCMLVTFCPRFFTFELYLFQNPHLTVPRPGSPLNLVLLIALFPDNRFFSPCSFMCLIIFDWMPDIMCRLVEIEVNNVHTWKLHFFSYIGLLL